MSVDIRRFPGIRRLAATTRSRSTQLAPVLRRRPGRPGGVAAGHRARAGASAGPAPRWPTALGAAAAAARRAARGAGRRRAAARPAPRSPSSPASRRACSAARCSRCSRRSPRSSWPRASARTIRCRRWPSSGLTPRTTTGTKSAACDVLDAELQRRGRSACRRRRAPGEGPVGSLPLDAVDDGGIDELAAALPADRVHGDPADAPAQRLPARRRAWRGVRPLARVRARRARPGGLRRVRPGRQAAGRASCSRARSSSPAATARTRRRGRRAAGRARLPRAGRAHADSVALFSPGRRPHARSGSRTACSRSAIAS